LSASDPNAPRIEPPGFQEVNAMLDPRGPLFGWRSLKRELQSHGPIAGLKWFDRGHETFVSFGGDCDSQNGASGVSCGRDCPTSPPRQQGLGHRKTLAGAAG